MARPTKLNKRTAARVLAALESGATIAGAAAAAGVGARTLRRWVERGRAGDAPYAEFVERYDIAHDAAETTWITRIVELAEARGDWRAYAWLLEHRFPAVWGSRAKVEHAHAVEVEQVDHGAFWRDLARQAVAGTDAALTG